MMTLSPGTLIALASMLFMALGVLGTQYYSRRKNRREDVAADDAASDRLIKLIEREAEKRVEIVRKEFELAIADMKLEHSNQLTAMRTDFERQIADLRRDGHRLRCDKAETCIDRILDGVAVNANGTI